MDAVSLLFPSGAITAVDEFLFHSRKGLKKQLAVVAKSEGVLAREAAGDLVDEDFAEDEIDGSGRLKIADGVEDIRGEKIAVGDAAEFAAKMIMAEGSVAGIRFPGTALAVGTKMSAAVVG